MTSLSGIPVDALTKLATTGDPAANLLLAYSMEKGLAEYSSADLVIATYRKALAGGIVLAGYLLGLLEAERGNVDECGSAMREAANGGVARAALFLGAGYAMDSDHFQRNIDSARFWLGKACDMGEVDAYRPLADIEFENGAIERAIELYKRGAQAGSPECAVGLARRLLELDPNNNERALPHLLDAARAGHPVAAIMLSSIYHSGATGVPRNSAAGEAFKILAEKLIDM